MTRSLVRFGALGALALVVALVPSGARAATTPAGEAAGPFAGALLGDLPPGTLYVDAGPSAISLNLWEERDGHVVHQLTHNPALYGISNFSASVAGIVMADARTGTDEMERLTSHGAVPLPYGGEGHGDDPQIDGGGAIAFVTIPYGSADHFRIGVKRTFDAAPTWSFTAAGTTPVGGLAWEPDGAIAFIYDPHDPSIAGPAPRLAEVARGRFRFLSGPGLDPRYLVWGPLQWEYAVTTWPGASYLRVPSSPDYARLPSGWVPACFGPSGASLLVVDGRRVGLVEVHAPGRVRPLGATPGNDAITQCEWLEEPAST